MLFVLDDAQRQFCDTLGSMLADRLPSTRLHRVFDGEGPFDVELWQELSDLGLSGVLAPEDAGGSGLTLFDAALAAEALGQAAAPVPFLGHSLAVLALSMAGGAVAQRWLPALASGEVTGTVAFHAPGGWRPGDWSLSAGARLDGECPFVPAAGEAPLIVAGLAGGLLALIPPGAPGVTLAPMAGIDRTRRLALLRLEGVEAQPLDLTPAQVERVADAALVLLAADAFGGACRVLDLCTAYARERVQYGRPIAGFQAVRHQLADMVSEVEPCRALWWHAAHAVGGGLDGAPSAAALAKAHCTGRFLQAARDGVELHGGIGFTWEHDMHIWLKRALFDTAWGGTPETHHLRYAALAGW